MLVSDLLKNIMQNLGEDYGDLEARDVFLKWLIEVYEEVLADNDSWSFQYSKEILTTSSGSHTYTLSSALETIVSVVEQSSDSPLKLVDITDLTSRGYDLDQSGDPSHFVSMGISSGAQVIRLWPVPTSAKNYDVFSTLATSSLAITDTLPMPAGMAPALRFGVKSLYYLDVGDTAMYDRLRLAFLKAVQAARGRYAFTRARRWRLGVGDVPGGSAFMDAQLPGDFPRT